jgi:hypothetical protein
VRKNNEKSMKKSLRSGSAKAFILRKLFNKINDDDTDLIIINKKETFTMKLNNLLHSFSANKPVTDTVILNKTDKITSLIINKPNTKAVNLLALQIASGQKDTHIYKPIQPQTVQTAEPMPDELSFFIKFDKDKKARPRIPESVLTNPKPKEATEKYLKDVVNKYYVYIKDIEDQSAKIDDQTGQKTPTKSPEQIAQLKKRKSNRHSKFSK